MRLYHETAELEEPDVIEKLCDYFQCKIADLLEIEK